jgi:ectoine hydroxylase-related dioxygenase (phytanoyl-CoA dioxygenase family)
MIFMAAHANALTVPVSPEQQRQLNEAGYLLLPQMISADLRGRLVERLEQLFAAEGAAAGSEFKQEPGARRLANLVDKDREDDPMFAECIDRPDLLPFVAAVLPGDPRRPGRWGFKLSSLNARSANPGSGVVQPLHADGGALPDQHGFWVCNLLFMLDDFTAHNGALRVVPGTHRTGSLPALALADPLAPHPSEVKITGSAGDVLVLNSHLWHGGLANDSDQPRRALHVYYCRHDKPQQQHQRALLRAEVQARLTPAQRELCALDDPLNDALAKLETGKSGFLR